VACRAKQVKGAPGAAKLDVVTIYAAQSPEQQMMVFQSTPLGTRKASPILHNSC
jgi:HrpA-like RNA helicase